MTRSDFPDYALRPNWVRLSDLPNSSPEVLAGIESAYRRGYTQGFWAAMEAMQDGASEKDLDEHFDDLREWRLKRKGGTPEQPPYFSKGTNNA